MNHQCLEIDWTQICQSYLIHKIQWRSLEFLPLNMMFSTKFVVKWSGLGRLSKNGGNIKVTLIFGAYTKPRPECIMQISRITHQLKESGVDDFCLILRCYGMRKKFKSSHDIKNIEIFKSKNKDKLWINYSMTEKIEQWMIRNKECNIYRFGASGA